MPRNDAPEHSFAYFIVATISAWARTSGDMFNHSNNTAFLESYICYSIIISGDAALCILVHRQDQGCQHKHRLSVDN